MILLVFQPVSDGSGFSPQHFLLSLSELDFPLPDLIQDLIKRQSPFGLASLDLKASVDIPLDINKVLIQVSVIVSGSVEDSLQFFLVLLYFYHFQAILEESVLLNVVQNVLV
jgi:hypothetical protein